MVQGPGPGPRYGHVMALVGQRYLMAIGGNDGGLLPVIAFHSLSCVLKKICTLRFLSNVKIKILCTMIYREEAFGRCLGSRYSRKAL